MIETWIESGKCGVTSVGKDNLTLSLHILTSAGFGVSHDFQDAVGESNGDLKDMNYRDCLEVVLRDILMALLLPRFVYRLPYLPKSVENFIRAKEQLKKHMEALVKKGKDQAVTNNPSESNLLNMLVLKSEETNLGPVDGVNGEKSDKTSISGLSDKELYGNIFMFSFAGHETTGHSLSFTIYLLVAFPEWQDWIHLEIDEVLGDRTELTTESYDEVFPQLTRCLALLVRIRTIPSPKHLLFRLTLDSMRVFDSILPFSPFQKMLDHHQ